VPVGPHYGHYQCFSELDRSSCDKTLGARVLLYLDDLQKFLSDDSIVWIVTVVMKDAVGDGVWVEADNHTGKIRKKGRVCQRKCGEKKDRDVHGHVRLGVVIIIIIM
jgi:hypothetical protein